MSNVSIASASRCQEGNELILIADPGENITPLRNHVKPKLLTHSLGTRSIHLFGIQFTVTDVESVDSLIC